MCINVYVIPTWLKALQSNQIDKIEYIPVISVFYRLLKISYYTLIYNGRENGTVARNVKANICSTVTSKCACYFQRCILILHAVVSACVLTVSVAKYRCERQVLLLLDFADWFDSKSTTKWEDLEE